MAKFGGYSTGKELPEFPMPGLLRWLKPAAAASLSIVLALGGLTPANAATVGSGDCAQTYTGVSGSVATDVYSWGKYCFVGFYNTGGLGTQSVQDWQVPAGVSSADILIVAGGGGGGTRHAGGGGAGGLLDLMGRSIPAGGTLRITVGAGGAGATQSAWAMTYPAASRGMDSSITGTGFTAATATGGGAGGLLSTAGNGGSGGGGYGSGENGAGISGQGYAGGTGGYFANPDSWASGGGGGATGQGGNATSTAGGSGGSGKWITWLNTEIANNVGPSGASIGEHSTVVYFAGGGGGGTTASSVGGGGIGGGGDGGISTNTVMTNPSYNDAMPYTGGGGGGSGISTDGSDAGGDGGSGLVLIRYSLGPSAPGSVNVTNVAATTATVSFTSPSYAPMPITKYQWSNDGSSWFDIAGTTSPLTVTGLTEQTNYTGFRIRAVSGAYSGEPMSSNIFTTRPLPASKNILSYNSSDINSFDSVVSSTVVNDLSLGNIDAEAKYSVTATPLTLSNQTWAFSAASSSSDASYLDVADFNTDFSSGLTVDFEADFGSTTNSWERIIDFGESAVSPDDNIIVGRFGSTNNLTVEVWRGGQSYGHCLTSGGIEANSGMHRWTVTLNGSTCQIAKDGVLVNVVTDVGYQSSSVPGGIAAVDNSVGTTKTYNGLPLQLTRTSNYIGRSNWSGDSHFEGKIRSLRIYNDDFSATELGAVSYSTVYFNAGVGGSVSPTSLFTSGTLRVPTAAKTGYSNGGWSTTIGGSAVGVTYTPTTNTELHALWTANTYNVSVAAGSASGASGSPIALVKSHDTSLTLPDFATANATFSRPGYAVLGWATSAAGTTKVYDLGASYAANSATTLYPYWVASSLVYEPFNSSTSVAAIWRVQDGAASPVAGRVLSWTRASSVAYPAGTSFVLPLVGADNYMAGLGGGSPRLPAASVASSALGTSVSMDSNNTYYMSFLVDPTTNGQVMAGLLTAAPTSVADNDDKAMMFGVGYETVATNGYQYVFDYGPANWMAYCPDNATSTCNSFAGYTAKTSFSPTKSDADLGSAMVLAKITASAAGNDQIQMRVFRWNEVVPANDSSITWDLTYSAPITGTFTRLGYQFDGVGYPYLDEVRVAYTYAEAMGPTSTQTVTFNANDGTGSPATITQTVSTSVATNLVGNTFTRTGYAFDGWATTTTGAVAYADKAAVTTASDITLYAKWRSTTNKYVSLTSTSPGGATTTGKAYSRTGVNFPSSTNFTVEGWFYEHSGATGQNPLIAQGSNGNSGNFVVWVDGNPRYLRIKDRGTNVDTSVILPKQTWHHFAYTRSGNSYEVFIDGVSVQAGTLPNPAAFFGDFYLGENAFYSDDDDGHYFHGRVDQVKIWDAALTSADVVKSMHAYGNAGVTGKNLSHHYSFDEASTTSAADNAGTANLSMAGTGTNPAYADFALTATFSENGGSAVTDPTFHNYSLIQRPSSPTKTGATFGGWATTLNDPATEVAFPYAPWPFQNVTLYANWDYVITFKANDGASTADSTQTVTGGYPTALTANAFTRAGYTFSGWNSQADGLGSTNYADGASVTITSATTLYAKWTPNSVNITFDANDGSGSPATSTQAVTPSVATALTSNTFTRTGYTFAGWATSPNGAVAYANGSSFTTASATTLYAKWTANTYTVTYDYDGADGGTRPVDSQYTVGGASITLPSPTKTGLLFSAWYADAGLTQLVGRAGDSYSPTQSLTLYAKWTNLLVNLDGSDDASLPNSTATWTSVLPASSSAVGTPYGNTAYFSGSGLEGVRFDDSADAVTFPAGTGMVDGAMTVETWIKPGNLEENWNIFATRWFGNTSGLQSETDWHLALYRTGSNARLNLYTTNRSAMESDYLFPITSENKWFHVGFTIDSSNVATLYVNGKASGSFTNAGHVAKPNALLILGDSRSTNTMDGDMAKFRIYNKALSASEMFSTYSLEKTSFNQVVVTLNANDGSGSPDTFIQTRYSGTSTALPSNPFTRSGYTFLGWTANSDGTGTSYTNSQAISLSSDTTLYAKWTPRYVVTYNYNAATGGNSTATSNFDVGGTAITLPTPTKTGAVFAGWYGSSDFSGAQISSPYSPSQSTTLYAKWTEVTGAPSAPRNVTAVSSAGGLNLSWAAPTRLAGLSVTGYRVEYSTNGSSWTTATDSLSSSTLSYEITGLTTGNAYYVRVAALTSSGRSAYGYPWTLIYETTQGKRNSLGNVDYSVDTSSANSSANFTRVRYRLQATYGGQTNYADVDFNRTLGTTAAGSETYDSITKLRVPTTSSAFEIQANVSDLSIESNVSSGTNFGNVENGYGLEGRLEIWPWNYENTTSAGFSSRIAATYDDSDTWSTGGVAGDYGSFQLHRIGSLNNSSVFSWNRHYNSTPMYELGFGNYSGANSDWTFCAGDAGSSGCQTRSDFKFQSFVNIPVTVTASVTVTFDANDGSQTPATSTQGIPSGTATSLTANSFTRTGYTFAGWATSRVGTVAYADQAPITAASATTLYAKWTLNTYTVTLQSGADGTGNNQTLTKTYGQDLTLPNSSAANGYFTRTGHTVTGWATADGGAQAYALGGTFTTDSATTLYPVWTADTYTVTYDANGATGTPQRASDSFTYGGSAITLPLVGSMVKAGFTFDGWSATVNGAKISGTYTPTGSVTLYARWIAGSYTLVYEYNGADGANSTVSDSFTTGATAVTLPVPTKTGYNFAGWYRLSNLSGSAIGSTYSPTSNQTIYAKWAAIAYSVVYNADIVVGGITYSPNSGTVPTDADTYNIGQNAPVKTNSGNLVRTGYTFGGWVTNLDGTGTALNSGQTVTIGSSNVQLYPKWNPVTYTITYNKNGSTGSLARSSDTYTTGDPSLTLPGAGTMTKIGYNFAGWATSPTGAALPATYSTTTDITLYAKWTIKSISFTYARGTADGLSLSGYTFTNFPASSAANYGTSITLGAPDDELDTDANAGPDFKFFGWSDGTSVFPAGQNIVLGEASPTFTAQWVKVFAVRYALAGGTPAGSESNVDSQCLGTDNTCTNGQTITLNDEPTRAGYTFDGWLNQAGNLTHAAATSTMITATNYLFYAQWTAIDYNFSFNSNGGSQNHAALTKNIGQLVTMPNPGSKAHHTFAGWSDGTNTFGTGTTYTVGTQSVQFEAIWTPNVYTVSYDWQGAVGTVVPAVNYTYGSGSMTLPTIGDRVKDGYTFSGWSLSPNGALVSGFVPTSNTTLYAVWADGNYTLSFAPAGGTIGSGHGTVGRGAATTLPTPVRAGFRLKGWYDQAAGGNKIADGGQSFTPVASRALYAQWVQNSLWGVDVATLESAQNYTADSNTAVATTLTHVPTGTSASINIPAGALPNGTNVTVRYFRDDSRQQDVISDQNSYLFSLLVSWLYGSGDSATVPDTSSGKPITVTLNNSAIRAGMMVYMVIGDQVTELATATQDGTVTVQLTTDPEIVVAATPPSAPTEVSAIGGDQKATVSWTAPSSGGSTISGYTVTASPGGATCTTTGATTCEVTGLTNGTPYTFSVTATNAVGTSTPSAATQAVTPAPITYVVTYDANGGSSVGNGSFPRNGSIAAAPSSPSRAGFNFGGWSTVRDDAATLVAFPYTPSLQQALTLYALWSAASPGGSSGVVSPPVVVSVPDARAWTKRIDDSRFLINVKYPKVPGTYRVYQWNQSSGKYALVATLAAADQADPRLVTRGTAFYFQKTLKLIAGKNRIRLTFNGKPVLLSGEREFVTYTKK